jgi:putative RecB family exonuclease
MTDPKLLWDEAWTKSLGDTDLTEARVGGRKTIANPNKEDVTWWNKQGPQWVAEYIQWRENNPNWKIWVTPNGIPAIELDLTVRIADVNIKMVVDRVFEVDGQLVIVDLKTGKEPQSALQLGFYRFGLEHAFGVPASWGSYYMARKAGTASLIDLSWYSYEKMEYLVKTFDKSRKAGIFLPNAENCNMCSFTKQCQFTSKKEDQQ